MPLADLGGRGALDVRYCRDDFGVTQDVLETGHVGGVAPANKVGRPVFGALQQQGLRVMPSVPTRVMGR